jgi:hypothetical protein
MAPSGAILLLEASFPSIGENLAQEHPDAVALRVGDEFLGRLALDYFAAVDKDRRVGGVRAKPISCVTLAIVVHSSASSIVTLSAPLSLSGSSAGRLGEQHSFGYFMHSEPAIAIVPTLAPRDMGRGCRARSSPLQIQVS